MKPTVTLTEAVQRSLSQNPSLKVFPYRYAALTGQAEIAQLRPAYELSFEAENIAGTGNFSGVDSGELTIALSSVIEMGDKREARQGVVSYSRSVLDAKLQVASLALLGEVTRRYVEVLAAQEQLALAGEASDLAGESLRIVTKRAAAGATPEAEVRRAQAAAEQAKLALLAQQQRFIYMKVALAALWGSTTPDFDKVEGNLFEFGEDVAFDSLFAKVEKNPVIEIFAAESRLKDAELRLAQTQSRADIRWSLGVRQMQETDDTALVAGFSMPLFSGQRNSGAVTTALAEKNQVFAQREVMLLDLHTQLFRAFHNRKQAIVTVKALGSTIIPALEQALTETQAAYQRGRYGYLDYVSARQELLNARNTQIEAAAAALTFGAEIEQLTAESLASGRGQNNDQQTESSLR
ncbi:TolC family protein [Simiduia curdlanivorans]|uniref:TolC family protein n=1 Tax=Simiduia curdlanivorans TaxID=1492769 RepID=A0ABV8V8L0_9GAMM|nr:TolC family protein [Simiduia curdlanivorans]MDN3640682.1 TolC family protein [Simiduia curdlanivorans]